jgi:predicted DNA binding CopG/RHH family protein
MIILAGLFLGKSSVERSLPLTNRYRFDIYEILIQMEVDMKVRADTDSEQISGTEETTSPEGETPVTPKKKTRHKNEATVTLEADAAVATDGKEKKKKEKEKDKKKKKEKKNKEAVLVRFEQDQLAAIDDRAASLGLNRAAWLRMTVAQVLANT